ncbi:MAG: MBL fold metallo-hydrolase [Christensenellales bacterium]
MVIKTLAENTSITGEYRNQHGLSLFIQTSNHKVLFDTGADSLFYENALKTDVNIEDVDMVVISHGHYDHGGGLQTFFEINKKARVYTQKQAFDRHFYRSPDGETSYIGLDQTLKGNERIIPVENYFHINEELELFSNVKGKELFSAANKVLLMENGERLAEDDFSHEQNLIISENGKTILIAGCAHNGIVNIVKKFIEMKGKPADYVIGGFHLFNPSTKKSEDPQLVSQIGNYLLSTGSQYYTCHCTGIEAFKQLQAIMKDKIEYLSTGRIIQLF